MSSEVVYNRETSLCPYATNNIDGFCPYADGQCFYLHKIVCDYCGKCCLHPNDTEQQKQHRDQCIKEQVREMVISSAVKKSLEKECGICLDIVIEKDLITEREFGILEKCSHIFCLSCIKRWRKTKESVNRLKCPQCRVDSDLVIPSEYWYDKRSEKHQLIVSYKKKLSRKPCKYFKNGEGECPEADHCLYLHAYPDGRNVERRQNREDILLFLLILLFSFIILLVNSYFNR